jgi:hypothetical protein
MRYLFAGLAVLYSLSIHAQVSMAEFLRSASTDVQVTSFSEQLRYLSSKPYRLSPLRETEFRMRNYELEPGQMRYALRFSAANPWEMKYNNQFFRDYSASLKLEQDLVFKEALTQRYSTIIYYLYWYENKILTEEHLRLLDNQITLLEKQSGSSSFDADEYVKVKIARVDKGIDLEEIEMTLSGFRNQINQLYPEAAQKQVSWGLENLITIEQIQAILDTLSGVESASTLVEYRKQKINIANTEYKLEKSNINPGFIQTEYDQRRVENDRNPINITMGLTIPITNPNKGDMTKRRLDAIEAEYDLNEVKTELQTQAGNSYQLLKESISRYGKLKQQVEALQNDVLAENLSILKGNNPLYLIQFEVSRVRLSLLMAKQKRTVYLAYLDYLVHSDRLAQKPLLNFLSGNLEPIE